MPTRFSLTANSLKTHNYLLQTQLTRGNAPGINDPRDFSALAQGQFIDYPGDVDLIALTLVRGQTYTLDVDDGAGDGALQSVDLEFDLIDARGNLIANISDGDPIDRGSRSILDARFNFSVNKTGTYYVAVHTEGVDYLDEQFAFVGKGGTGDYSFVISSPGVPNQKSLTQTNDNVSYGGGRQNILALNGNDIINLGGGNDIADGGRGGDTIFGGAGSDEIAGNRGSDNLDGNRGDDVLVGGSGDDRMNGGTGNDHLVGQQGADKMNGGSGGDTLLGHGGSDILQGGAGDDFLRGGAGVDTLIGGSGFDTFHFLTGEARYDDDGLTEDRIQDFAASDLIDLSDLVGQKLRFMGDDVFTGGRQVRIEDFRHVNGYQEVQVNLRGNGTPELAFLVKTAGFTLGADDFLL